MKLLVRHAGGELTVGSQKEFLLLWQRGVITADDMVRREGQEHWTAAGELPWIRGMRMDERKDSRRLLWVTIALMLLGLAGALWIQGRAPQVAKRPSAPPGAVRALPR
jgi:GYF domain 2